MPTYVYACKQCGHSFEKHQSFSDAALTTCPECGGDLRKVYNSVGVSFKGSGFYRTDSRGAGSGSNASGSGSSGSNAAGTSGSDTSGSSASGGRTGSGSSSSGGSSSQSAPASSGSSD